MPLQASAEADSFTFDSLMKAMQNHVFTEDFAIVKTHFVMDLCFGCWFRGDFHMQSRFPAFVMAALQVFRWLAHSD